MCALWWSSVIKVGGGSSALAVAIVSFACGLRDRSVHLDMQGREDPRLAVRERMCLLSPERKDWLSCFRASAIIKGRLLANANSFRESPEQYISVRVESARDMLSGLTIPDREFLVFNRTAPDVEGEMWGRHYPLGLNILKHNNEECLIFLEGKYLLRCHDGRFHALLGPVAMSKLRPRLAAFLDLMRWDAFELAQLAASQDSRVERILQRLRVPNVSQEIARECVAELAEFGVGGMPGIVHCMSRILQEAGENRSFGRYAPGSTNEIRDTYDVLTRACGKIFVLTMEHGEDELSRTRILRLAAVCTLADAPPDPE